MSQLLVVESGFTPVALIGSFTLSHASDFEGQTYYIILGTPDPLGKFVLGQVTGQSLSSFWSVTISLSIGVYTVGQSGTANDIYLVSQDGSETGNSANLITNTLLAELDTGTQLPGPQGATGATG